MPYKNMRGHTIELLDNHLILGATAVDDEKHWWFMSLDNPRAGLLNNRWTETRVAGQKSPKNHVTFNLGNSLFYFGGDFKAQSKWEAGKWSLST